VCRQYLEERDLTLERTEGTHPAQPSSPEPAASQPMPDTRVAPRADQAASTINKLFTSFTVLACIVLSVQVVRLTRENTRLRLLAAEPAASQAATSAGSSALAVGEFVPDLAALTPLNTLPSTTSTTPSDLSTLLHFRDGRLATIILATSGGCQTCEASLPAFDLLARTHADQGIVVTAIQIDAMKLSELKPAPPSLPIVMVNDAPSTWLRRIPLVPAVIVIDSQGAVRQTWFGALSALQQGELDELIAQAKRGWN